jgi:hypothetical protein
VGAVVTGGVGAGGLATGEAVGGGGVTGGGVAGVFTGGGVVGVVTGGPLGLADGGFGLGRFRAGELGRLGSVRVVAAGRTTTVGRTASPFTAALCG